MKYERSINTLYFQEEFSSKKYLKQYIVMKIYNTMLRKWKTCQCIVNFNEEKPSLSEIWADVNLYFYLNETPVHTCYKQVNWADSYREQRISID